MADVQSQVRESHDCEAALIESYIAAATDYLDGYMGTLNRCIMPQTWQVTAELPYQVPFPDVITVTVDGVEAEHKNGLVDGEGEHDIAFTCGFEKVPEGIKQMIRMLVASWYLNRESTGSEYQAHALPHGFDMLHSQWRHRRVRIG